MPIASEAPKDADAVRDAIAGQNMDTMVGPMNFAGLPVKNVAITQVAGGHSAYMAAVEFLVLPAIRPFWPGHDWDHKRVWRQRL